MAKPTERDTREAIQEEARNERELRRKRGESVSQELVEKDWKRIAENTEKRERRKDW